MKPTGRNYSKSSAGCFIAQDRTAEDSGTANPWSISKIKIRFDCPLKLLMLLLVLNLWHVFVILKCILKVQLEQEESLTKPFIKKTQTNQQPNNPPNTKKQNKTKQKQQKNPQTPNHEVFSLILVRQC